ncbi:pantoate--beta-alanine ligase [Candidatus Aminicenantes bacterium AC-334-K16]|jgi:pantoate--beta-alanine ligase|nr:pantoate--beta-alanine ligase [Candidatus Aminicenantes bacterium AC-334-K16]
MKICGKISEIKKHLKTEKAKGLTIGFVPTMGYLHEGHLSLVRESLKMTDKTVVSIFVNPTQFGPREDYQQYPRNIQRDTAILEELGVDYLFVPAVEEMYPSGYKTYVEVTDLQNKLCGRSRPGHFRGVCTIVLKLFNIIQPDWSFFGQKDAQQAIIIQKMVEDLNLETKIKVLPIVRDKDGLALSSRNTYLSPTERKAALILYKSLQLARQLFIAGEKKATLIKQAMIDLIHQEPLAKIDYVAIVKMENFEELEIITDKALVAVAVFIGQVRLIDNIILSEKEKTHEKNNAKK